MPDARDNLAPPPAPPGPPDSLDPARVASFLLRTRTRYALAWAAAVVGSAIALVNAWTWCNDRARRDGNWGHASIDFGGQWAPARMIVLGQGRHLYDRGRLLTAIRPSYPRGDSQPSGANRTAWTGG